MTAVMLAAKLYEARRALKRIFADEYEAKIDPFRQVIRGAAAEFGCSALAAVSKVIADAKSRGHNPPDGHILCLMSAAADIAEAS